MVRVPGGVFSLLGWQVFRMFPHHRRARTFWLQLRARARSIYLRARVNARAFASIPVREMHTRKKASSTWLTPGKGKFSLVGTSALRACAHLRAPPSTKTPYACAQACARAQKRARSCMFLTFVRRVHSRPFEGSIDAQ